MSLDSFGEQENKREHKSRFIRKTEQKGALTTLGVLPELGLPSACVGYARWLQLRIYVSSEFLIHNSFVLNALQKGLCLTLALFSG